MNEQRLQFDIVKYYHNTHKEFRGLLFEVNNSTNKGASRKGQGMVAGVSDLVMCAPNGRFVGFELKAPGTRHKVDHLERQLRWAESVVKAGGLVFFVSELQDFKDIINILLGIDKKYDYSTLNDLCTLNLRGINNLLMEAVRKNVKSVKL